MTPDLKMARVALRLNIRDPFFGSIYTGLEKVKTDSVPTMATDGRSLFWNPSWVDTLTEEEALGVAVHEVCHVVGKHHLRRGDREPKKWNHAADYAINPMVLASKKDGRPTYVLPAGGLLDAKYTGNSAEKIYTMLPEPPEGPAWGEVIDLKNPDGSKMSKDQTDLADIEVDQKILQAADVAKSRGKMPGELEGLVDDIREGQVDWQSAMRRCAAGDQPDDYSYAKPNRKMWHHARMFNPGVKKTGVGNIVFAIDVSGSMSDPEVAAGISELAAIQDDMSPAMITVIQCDTKVTRVDQFGPGEPVDSLARKGYGGTLVKPVFDYVAENNIPCDAMIYITDMEVGDFPTQHPPYRLMWLATSKGVAPVGETVRIKVRA